MCTEQPLTKKQKHVGYCMPDATALMPVASTACVAALSHGGLMYKQPGRFHADERRILWQLTRMNLGLDGMQPRDTHTTYWGAFVPVAPRGGERFEPMGMLVHRGESLEQLASFGSHAIDERALRRGLAAAVEALADLGYAHDDLTTLGSGAPALRNITFDKGQYYLIDFGITRRLDADEYAERDALGRAFFVATFVEHVVSTLLRYVRARGAPYTRLLERIDAPASEGKRIRFTVRE